MLSQQRAGLLLPSLDASRNQPDHSILLVQCTVKGLLHGQAWFLVCRHVIFALSVYMQYTHYEDSTGCSSYMWITYV